MEPATGGGDSPLPSSTPGTAAMVCAAQDGQEACCNPQTQLGGPLANGRVRVTAWLMSGRPIEVTVQGDDTVAQVQQQLATELGVQFFQIQLYADTVPLQPNQRAAGLAGTPITLTVAGSSLWLYAAGGADKHDAAQRGALAFNVEGARVLALPAMRECRSYPSVAVLDRHLYVCGGERGRNGKEVLASVERLPLTTSATSWEPLPPMPSQRSGGSAVACGGKLYICGGHRGCKTYKSVIAYDPVARCWSNAAPMQAARGGASSVAVGGQVYVIGGNSGARALSCGEVFDPDKGVWEWLPRMQERRISPAAVVIGDYLYACGGGTGTHVLDSVERMHLQARRWESLPPMLHRRARGVALSFNGCLLVCGGLSTRSAEGSDCMECFHPGTGVWEQVCNMPCITSESTWAGGGDPSQELADDHKP